MNNHQQIQDVTLKIMTAILEIKDGYTSQQIEQDELAEQARGSTLWITIYDVISKQFSTINKNTI
jgi:hypothetical protein